MESLADYGTDEDSDSQPDKPPQRGRIPFPTALLGPKGDNSVDARGRVRAFPHVAGNWATHLYIPVDHVEEVRDAAASATQCAADVLSELGYEVHAVDDAPIHVSLSRTVVLHHHQIDQFVATCRMALSQCKPFRLILAGRVASFTNDIAARSFLAMDVCEGVGGLLDVVRRVDRVLVQFNQPTYYEPAHFHASICWWASGKGLRADELERIQGLIDGADVDSADVWVTSVSCKIGDKSFVFPFGT